MFVSYSDEDEAWVREELLKQIEEREPRMRACVHERDFQVSEREGERKMREVERGRER